MKYVSIFCVKPIFALLDNNHVCKNKKYVISNGECLLNLYGDKNT